MALALTRLTAWLFILVGVLGFFSGSAGLHAGLELGLFPVNLVHNLTHILVGLWGLNAARTEEGANLWCRQAAVLSLLLGVAAFVPAIVALFSSVVPIGGNDAFLHLGFAAVLACLGFIVPARDGLGA